MNKIVLTLVLCALAWSAPAAEFWPLDISSAARWGFHDEIAGDGKGGWTDQGPDVDLASLTVPKIEYGPAKFHILDEKTHPGATTMVLSRPVRGGTMKYCVWSVLKIKPTASTSCTLPHGRRRMRSARSTSITKMEKKRSLM